MTQNVRTVSIGEMVTSDAPEDVLVAYGLGSCVAVCMYDPVKQVGGMLHALLPAPMNENRNKSPTRFVDQGIPLLTQTLGELGALRSRLVVSICGGARMVTAPGFEDTLNIGERNVLRAKQTLQALGLRVNGHATGGTAGRTVRFYLADGQVTVKSLGKIEEVLRSSL